MITVADDPNGLQRPTVKRGLRLLSIPMPIAEKEPRAIGPQGEVGTQDPARVEGREIQGAAASEGGAIA
jgi:hypothetical protein